MKPQKRIIQLSFKNTPEEEKLYAWLLSKLSPAHFIKEEMWRMYNNIPTIYTQNTQPIPIADIPITHDDDFDETIERKITF